MAPVVHPGRFLKREMEARKLSANRLSPDIGVPSGRITDILNFRRAITADTAEPVDAYSIARNGDRIPRTGCTVTVLFAHADSEYSMLLEYGGYRYVPANV